MSIWTRIAEALSALVKGAPLSEVFELLKAPPEHSVAFTIAVIGLGAKISKADGRVTREEVLAFRDVFYIAPGEERNAARVFDLARQDVAGYEVYARRIARMFEHRTAPLADLLDGLFHIAVSDGVFHQEEERFLRTVHEIFGLPEREFRVLAGRHVDDRDPDPYEVLDVSPDTPLPQIRKAWHALARQMHPDALTARGLPEEAVRLAEGKMVAINRAWQEISSQRAA